MAPASAIPARGPRLNLVEQVFTVPERNRLWVGDITYTPTGEGRLYLATVIDAWSRKVVWWSMSNRMKWLALLDTEIDFGRAPASYDAAA